MNQLKQIIKNERRSVKIPKSVQDLIPIERVFQDGIFKIGEYYSKTIQFTDVNYAVASEEEKEFIFMQYSKILNAIDKNAIAKVTINNRKLDKESMSERILISQKDDGLNDLRDEYNDMLINNLRQQNKDITQERYFTVAIKRKSIDEARVFFRRFETEFSKNMGVLMSNTNTLSLTERLKIIHNFYMVHEDSFDFDLSQTIRKGYNFKDKLCPQSAEIKKDHIVLGNKYVRTLYMREYANYIDDEMISKFTELPINLMFSIDVYPIPTNEAIKMIDLLMLGVETDKAKFMQKQARNNNHTAEVPYEMQQRTEILQEMMHDMTQRDQSMLLVTITLVLMEDSLEELDRHTEMFKALAEGESCKIESLSYQQIEGLFTALPFGCHKLPYIWRTLTTESTAIFMPFVTQEINDDGGIYYGKNVVSKNMIIADRRKLKNGNGFILGSSGSGKSFKVKEEIAALRLRDNVDIIIIDPEREYETLAKKLGGEVIRFSAGSKNYINAMDISKDYGESQNPVIFKSNFILSLFEQRVGSGNLDAIEKSIIDRCVNKVYKDFIANGYTGTPPTLNDLRIELTKQSEEEAKYLAVAIENITIGSYNTFSQQTNVDVDSSLLVYDILELENEIRTIGMLTILDNILNRITQNRRQGKETFIYVDEIYLLFQNEYSADFLYKLWKRVRKYGAFCTGITQNVGDLLQSHTAETMLANSEFLVLLNQAGTDREKLANLIDFSDTQKSHITDAPTASGLVKINKALVPMEDNFPENTELYRCMTTKLDEIATYNREQSNGHKKESVC